MKTGSIKVSFKHGKLDSLQMIVKASGQSIYDKESDENLSDANPRLSIQVQKFTCLFSPVFCPFRDFIAWLEALTTGVHECAFEWDAEGTIGKIGLAHHRLELVSPLYSDKPEERLVCFVDRQQVVRAFYLAFRKFVESPSYDPERYEKIRFGEELSIRSGRKISEQEIRQLLLPTGAAEANSRIKELENAPRTRQEEHEHFLSMMDDWVIKDGKKKKRKPYQYIPFAWNKWDEEKRSKHLDKLLDWKSPMGTDTNIRELKSEIVEAWIRKGE